MFAVQNYSTDFWGPRVEIDSSCPISAPPVDMSVCQVRLDLTLDFTKLKANIKNKRLAKNIEFDEKLQRRYLFHAYKTIVECFNREISHSKLNKVFYVLEYMESGVLHSHGLCLFESECLGTCLRKLRALARRLFFNVKFCCIEMVKSPEDSVKYLCKPETKARSKIYRVLLKP